MPNHRGVEESAFKKVLDPLDLEIHQVRSAARPPRRGLRTLLTLPAFLSRHFIPQIPADGNWYARLASPCGCGRGGGDVDAMPIFLFVRASFLRECCDWLMPRVTMTTASLRRLRTSSTSMPGCPAARSVLWSACMPVSSPSPHV
jgi:hypothetical protein